MKTLEQCRKEIDALDQQIAKLFEQRMNVAKEVVQYKIANELEIFHPQREVEVIEKNVSRISNDTLKDYAKIFFQDMMDTSKAYQATFLNVSKIQLQTPKEKNITVGFQGVPGSFSHSAMVAYFGETQSNHYEQFEDVYQAIKNNQIDYGIVPLENSSTGAIHDNYDLIRDYHFSIVGEISIPIHQNLLVVKGTKIEEITDVYSHPQGLLQASMFLKQYPHIKQHDFSNTAAAAKYVASQNNKKLAAIASNEAANYYGLENVYSNINNANENETRFIVISKHNENHPDATRVSVVFTLSHKPGSLYSILKAIKAHNINLCRIESRPIVNRQWEYYFYIDFEGNLAMPQVQDALNHMKGYCHMLEVIGNYRLK